METKDLYKDIQGLLTVIKDDEKKLTKVLTFLEDEILNEYTVESKLELPSEYRDTICQIADAIDTGVICYLNPDTMEIEQVQNRTVFDSEEYEEQNDDMLDEFALNYQNWDSYIKFEPLEQDEVYRLMENFVNQLNNVALATQLEDALSGQQSMPDFMRVIQANKENDTWIKYKRQETVNHVKNILLNEMRLR